LPALFNQLRAEFEHRRSLAMPWEEAVSATLEMGLAPEGMSRGDAGVYLRTLAAAAPEWMTLEPHSGPLAQVRVARMCTGVWERLVQAAR
jgi:hypothetical protein